MITLTPRGIRWEREDVRLMAKILGVEAAVVSRTQTFRYAPPVMSILKLAKKKNGMLSRSAERALEDAIILRRQVRALAEREDAELHEYRAEKYFRHQRADLARMYHFPLTGYLNASEAGVGKTLTAVRYAHHLHARHNLIICTNAAKDQWADEIAAWTKGTQRIDVVRGTVKQQIAQITAARGWVIGHWESLVHAREGYLNRAWDFTVLDEAQHIQSRNAQRTETVFKLRAEHRMALSAHPYANGVSELFPILKFLYPSLYPGFWRWANMHIEIDEGPWGGLDLRSPRRPTLLQWEIEPFTIRRLWKDVWKNLPPITRVQRTAELTPSGRREYDRLKKQFFVALEAHRGETNILAIPSMLARVTRLRQYLIDPSILGARERSVKYPIVYDLIKELDGFPPVIFTMYREAATRLQAFLRAKKLKVPMIAGGMKHRINPLKKQFLRGKFDAIIILISVGGTSLNFGKYGKVIYLDHPWTHKDVEQTEGRVRRPEEGTGIIVPTTSYHVVVKDSYEERMKQTRKDKHKDFAKVFTVAQAKELFQ